MDILSTFQDEFINTYAYESQGVLGVNRMSDRESNEEPEQEVWKHAYELIRLTSEYAYREACEKQHEKAGDWQFSTFILSQFKGFLDSQIKKEKGERRNNLVFHRLTEWMSLGHWCILAGYSGAYETVARELRFLIEDVVQSIYLEEKLGNAQIEAKVRAHSILDDFRRRGKEMIDRVISGQVKHVLNNLYGNLSGYVHPTAERIKEGLGGERWSWVHNETLFLKSLQLYTQVYDGILALLLTKYPDIISPMYSQYGEQLEQYGYEHTLKLCREAIPDLS